ncbi:hypothetical protein ABZR86_06490 [Dyella marensis]|uniref:hypothetical protein n=1 Tax=Dyella TaxID=231454 RepID=UPI00054D4692|nr:MULTISPECIES: hypothetical protein [Dyella]
MSTTDNVVDILVREGGYRILPKPLKVGSIPFDFTYALVAGNRANDLVIIIELKGDTTDDGVTRKVMALTRALDVMQSKRPVTAVLTSGQPLAETVRSIGKVCRVLPVGAPTGADAMSAVRDWLSVLLPLAQPPAVETLLDWQADLGTAIAAYNKNEFVDTVIKASQRGKDSVEKVLADAITLSIDAALNDEGERK